MQQKTKQNAKQTVVHTTKDNEDRAERAEQNRAEQSLVYLPLPLKYSALRNIATANRPITEPLNTTDRRPATQKTITFTVVSGKNK